MGTYVRIIADRGDNTILLAGTFALKGEEKNENDKKLLIIKFNDLVGKYDAYLSVTPVMLYFSLARYTVSWSGKLLMAEKSAVASALFGLNATK